VIDDLHSYRCVWACNGSPSWPTCGGDLNARVGELFLWVVSASFHFGSSATNREILRETLPQALTGSSSNWWRKMGAPCRPKQYVVFYNKNPPVVK